MDTEEDVMKKKIKKWKRRVKAMQEKTKEE